jgi:predicted tellurium resistance membrane protein TerC
MLMEVLLDPGILAGLATLILLEVVLGIDNLVFIAILADKRRCCTTLWPALA